MSQKKKKNGKILHSVKLWKKCLESRWPWEWLSQCCTCPGCSLLSRWLVTLLPWCVPFHGAWQVQTARYPRVENGCDGGGRNDAKKVVVVENWAEEQSLLGLNSSSTSYWWNDLGRFVSPPASVLWAVKWDDLTVCLLGLASGCRELRHCECIAQPTPASFLGILFVDTRIWLWRARLCALYLEIKPIHPRKARGYCYALT